MEHQCASSVQLSQTLDQVDLSSRHSTANLNHRKDTTVPSLRRAHCLRHKKATAAATATMINATVASPTPTPTFFFHTAEGINQRHMLFENEFYPRSLDFAAAASCDASIACAM